MAATAYILGSGVAPYIDAIKVDFGDPTDITDAKLRDLLVKSIRRINIKIGTSFEYFAASSGIVPTPTEVEAELILLQAECLYAKRRYATAVSKGIKIKDGDTSIDTTGSFGGQSEVKNDVCKELDDLIMRYRMDSAGASTNGECIWHGNTYSEYDHDHGGYDYHTRTYKSPTDIQFI